MPTFRCFDLSIQSKLFSVKVIFSQSYFQTKLFSELKLVTDNLLFIWFCVVVVDCWLVPCFHSLVARESKRKTAAVVSMRNGERLFGEAALSTVSRSAL